ncbi:DUF1918 domain-containing protein [Capillimicrobium parvum]|uniref:DUF1918 domain-containing protein n=1 Tax=Capillimicrobium parvum TaxID=2884022 RepID=A0A9E7BYM0_9ACTN|nr:DUF1918 domain-containing protein [Capillimicrobium parvum]UGS34425.1 hypothetical protein DSM104329_00803 [Capillimicrobium parvum]
MTDHPLNGEAAPGDWIVARGLPGRSPRKGLIVVVLGEGAHEHYLVKWDEQHESIFFPADGVGLLREGEDVDG